MRIRSRRRSAPAQPVQLLEPRTLLAADLTSSFRTLVLPKAPIAGVAEKGTAVISVANADAEAIARTAPRVNVTVALRPVGTAGEADILIGTAANVSVAGLTGTRTKTAAVKLTFPSTVPVGTYSVVSIVDSSNTIDESNEANNAAPAAAGYVVAASTADLAADSATTTLSGKAKKKTGTVRVSNAGNVSFKGTVDITFVATAAGQTDQVLGTATGLAVNLKPHQGRPLRPVQLTAPTATTAVTFNLTAIITPHIAPSDTNTGNNSAPAGTIALTPSSSNPGTPPGTAANPLASLGLGDRLTFTKTGSLPGDGLFGSTNEQGTVSDQNGKAGKYFTGFVPPIGAGLKNNILDLDFNTALGFSRRFTVAFKSKAVRPSTLNGISYILTTSAAGSVATVTDVTGTQVFYLKLA